MQEQTKLLLIGASVAAVSKFYLQKDWKMSLLFGAATIVALVVYDTATNPV